MYTAIRRWQFLFAEKITILNLKIKRKEIKILTYVDMADEIQSRFDDAIENGTDELDVYMEMLEAGIDVSMVRKYLGDNAAEHMQNFCGEHGLI